jgi:hypothetical protein
MHTHRLAHTYHHVGGGAAVLDIGGDMGALVALMDPAAEGTELFLRRDGEEATVHTGVWTRHQDGNHVTAALFCELAAGTYWVLDDAGTNRLAVDISGGELVEIDLRP